jgi:hypothetical protein
MSLRLLAVQAALATALLAGSASAQEASEEEKDDKPTTAEQIASLADALEGVRDKKADTVGDNAGEIEAAIMSAAALRKAANQVCANVIPKAGPTVYFVTEADLQQARRAGVLLAQMEIMTGFLSSYQRGQAGAGGGAFVAEGRGFIPIAGAVSQLLSALLRNDDTISAISGTIDDESTLANMMLDYKKNGKGCFGTDSMNFAQDHVGNMSDANNVITKLNLLNGSYQSFLGKIGTTPTDSEKQIKSGYESFITALSTSQNGTTAIEALIRTGKLWQTLSSTPSAALLRLSIDKSGGTLLKRKNLWTALGARSLAVTAGIVVSYRVSDTNGEALSGGTIYCTTAQTNFANLHRIGADGVKADCSNLLGVPQDEPAPKASGRAAR